ncbi:MFS general substrate transporter [Xylona heveae TC161]|uniref:MFS general substrate transporter n=1 Tax=Xylona heveae (strain CBS 132557 / TC161) TaxID=1328760 RepID=A0A165GYX6_XYLHT|nr:MFS general substrate transporter [Xylona heveae TC161]KZF22777.1 MFS general substrate transporter [Xylona heveae TC161]
MSTAITTTLETDNQPTSELGSSITCISGYLTGIHARDRTPDEGGEGKVFVVGWEGDNDPLKPHNWSIPRRVAATLVVSCIAIAVTAASSIDSAVLPQSAAEFGVSDVAGSLATGMFLMGFGCGALFAGPFSETFGRNAVYMSTMLLFMIWIMASALAPNIGAQIIFRFLAGFFGSTPLTCAGGTVADLWDPLEKTFGFPLFAIAGFGGPVLGPVIGSYIGPGAISWRWSEWIMLIIGGLVLSIVFFFQPETYAPLLLSWKAKHYRELTGDDRFRSEMEIRTTTLLQRLMTAVYRPFVLTWTEPIILLMSLYLTVIYIVLFTFLDGYTFIFSDIHGLSQGLTNILWLGMLIGILSAVVLVPVVYKWTRAEFEKVPETERATFKLHPETRLWYAMLGAAPAVPISLLWMGWTSYPSISLWSPLASSVLFGYGVMNIFISAYMYVIDSYEIYAASALSFVAFTRYLAAGGMTIVGIPFYKNVGVHWTLTILAIISAIMAPVPYLLYRYGVRVRRFSKYAVTRA